MRKNQGFTLVEILIVVVILGILAAIVIPQFSDASTQSKVSSAKSSLQTMRSQLSLYAIQHKDEFPDVATFEDEMTTYTDIDRDPAAAKDATHTYGPYLQSLPKNPFTDGNTVSAVGGGGDWEFNPTSGKIILGGGGYTDFDGSSDNTNSNGDEEVHANW